MVASSQTGVDTYNEGQPAVNAAASRAGIAMLMIAHAVYGISYNPLLPMYPPEVLATRQRSTGIGMMVLTLNSFSGSLRQGSHCSIQSICRSSESGEGKGENTAEHSSLYQFIFHPDCFGKGEQLPSSLAESKISRPEAKVNITDRLV